MSNQQAILLKKQQGIIYADGTFFDIVGQQWLAGNPATALKDANKVVLTDERARTYFPGLSLSQIIGKQVIYNDSIATTVSGIVKAQTENTDLGFHDIISMATVLNNNGLKKHLSIDNWGMINGSQQLYVKLAPGITVQNIEKQLAVLNKKYVIKHKNFDSAFKLEPLADLHFNSDYHILGGRMANRSVLYSLLIVASFLLLLGCINFINLSTAHAAHRAKEIGVRKTMGSSKLQLITQFLSETGLIAILATLLSIVLTPFLLKAFSNLIPPDLHFNLIKQPDVIIFLLLLIIVVSLLSGFYPSWVLSQYSPVLVLKNQAHANTGKTRKVWLRKSLTMFQFLIAQVFIMGTFIVAKQIHYTLNKDLGFKKDAIVDFDTPYFTKQPNSRFVLFDRIKSLPGVEMASLGGNTPASDNYSTGEINYKDGKKEIQNDVQFKYGDTNYLKLFHIKILAGRNTLPGDTVKEGVINETYAHILGFTDVRKAVGQNLDWNGVKLPIVGVVADFNMQSLHQPIKPMLFSVALSNCYSIHIALKPQNEAGTAWQSTIGQVQKAYKEIYPAEDFEYAFYDDTIGKFYQAEQNISKLLAWATGLAILISCLGLLGLVIYTTNQRTKEIGIRKVLGASVTNIVSILSTDFVKLVLVSFIIALPIAWYAMHKWLQNFAYRTAINWWVFALSGLLMVLIAAVTLSFQTIRAAVANPAQSLKNE